VGTQVGRQQALQVGRRRRDPVLLEDRRDDGPRAVAPEVQERVGDRRRPSWRGAGDRSVSP
jgi:hypothetical protein